MRRRHAPRSRPATFAGAAAIAALAGAGLAVAFAPAPAAAQHGATAQGDAGGAGPALAADLAQRWGVAADAVVLDWGSEPEPAGVPVRVLGSGAGGVFVVELALAGTTAVERRRVRAGTRARVAVAGRDLERGAVLEPVDIAHRDTVLWGGPGGSEAVEPGWVARRRIGAGTPLAAPAVAPPAAVASGEPVTLVWRGGSLEVTTRATAAGTAGVGERVAVRTESGRRIWGVAESRGTVRIGGGPE